MGLKPRSQLYAEEHQRHAVYHEREAVEHEAHREAEAADLNRKAAEAHQAAADIPLNDGLSRKAMRASAVAGEMSQRVRNQRRL